MWERFSFYGMRALLVLYLTQHFLFSDNDSQGIYAAYASLVYLMPLIGGFIADRYLGARKAVNDTIRRADAEQGAVDLDAEAARMLELQQNYQAAAQVMTVAQEMFDTLLNSL